MRFFRISIEWGLDDHPPERESQTDAMVERAHPDDVSQRAELDTRRPIGFAMTRHKEDA